MDAKGETSVMYVDNTQSCFGEIQWAYAAAALGVTLPFYIGFAVWLVHYTKIELIFSHAAGELKWSCLISFRRLLSPIFSQCHYIACSYESTTT